MATRERGAILVTALVFLAVITMIGVTSMRTSTIGVRMAAAQAEMSHWEEADYLIINEDFDVALSELQAVVASLRLRTSQQRVALEALIDELLAP